MTNLPTAAAQSATAPRAPLLTAAAETVPGATPLRVVCFSAAALERVNA